MRLHTAQASKLIINWTHIGGGPDPNILFLIDTEKLCVISFNVDTVKKIV